jgi:hypothetical protein
LIGISFSDITDWTAMAPAAPVDDISAWWMPELFDNVNIPPEAIFAGYTI